MGEISACAEDPLRNNGTQKTMLTVKSDFGIEDATQLLEQTTNASDVIVYGMAFNPMTPFRDKVWRAFLSSLARPTECWGQVDGVSFQEKDGYMVWLLRVIPTSKELTDNTRVSEAAPIREGWSGRRRGMCFVVTH